MNNGRTKIIAIISIAITVMALSLLMIFIYLPVIVQNHIIPDLVERTGLPPQQIQVRHIGIWGADLGPLRFSGNGKSFLQIDTIRISYTPLTLWHRKINAIEVIGVSAPMQLNENNLCVAGFCTQSRSMATSQQQPPALDLKQLSPMAVDTIAIKRATIAFHWQDRILDIPLDVALDTRSAGKGDLFGSATLSPKGNAITVEFTAHDKNNRADISISGTHLRPQDFSFLWEPRAPLAIETDADVKAEVTLQLDPLQVAGLNLSAVLPQLKLITDDSIIEGTSIGQGNSSSHGKNPITISLNTRDFEQWHLTCSPFELTMPLRLHMLQVQADIDRKQNGWQLTSTSRMRIPAQPATHAVPNLSLDRPVDLDWRINANASRDGAIELKAAVTGIASRDEILISYPPVTLSSRQPRMALSLTSDSKGLKVQGSVNGGPTRVSRSRAELNCPGFDFRMAGTFAESIQLNADLVLSEPAIAQSSLSATLPEAVITAQMVRPSDRPWQMSARVRTHKGLIQDSSQGLAVTDFSLDLPVQWPHAKQVQQGSLSAGAIRWRGRRLGGLVGTLKQQNQTLIGDFSHTSRLVAGLQLSVKTILDKSGARLDFNLPAFEPKAEIELGQFIPEAAGFKVNGRFQGRAELNLTAKGLDGTARMAMDQGSIIQADGTVKLSGISTELAFHQLPLLRSAPRQPIQISRLQIGNIRAEDLSAKYQIEPPATLFIEKAGLNWCQGTLNTQSIRIQPEKDELDLTIFCNQLNLAQVLTQLGVAQGSGDGTVNGRIPLRWTIGALAFDPGFLYSTPGQTGSIQLFNTQTLLQGMPKEAPQYVQLDIASEALKDYTYNWAKVNLESQNDILKVSLKLDGKPNQLLPFAYDQQRGQFMRIQGRGQAEFKGIDIDLNFQIPLNQILQMKEIFTSPNTQNRSKRSLP